MHIKTETDHSRLYQTNRGALRITQLAPTVTLHTLRGVGTIDLLEPITRDARRILNAHGKCLFLVDSYDQTAIRADLREQLTEFFREQRHHDFSAGMLMRSKLIEMAATVANMIAGISFITLFSKVHEWEAFAQRDVPGFRRRPILPESTTDTSDD